MSEGTIEHADGRVELRAPEELEHSPLYSEDLAPVPVVKRTWTNKQRTIDLWVRFLKPMPTIATVLYVRSLEHKP